MTTAQLMRRAAAYRSARPRYVGPQRSFGRSTGELKGVDTLLALSPVINTTGTNASSFTLNLITPGTASYNRVGRKAQLKSVRIKGSYNFSMTPSAAGVVPGNACRMVLVWDKQTNGAVPVWSDIFGYTLQDATEASTVDAQPKFDNMARFQILKDVTIDTLTVAGNVVSTAVVDQQIHFDYYVPLNGKETTYSGQNSPCTIADISTGALYVFFRAQTNGSSNIVSVDADSTARLRYVD